MILNCNLCVNVKLDRQIKSKWRVICINCIYMYMSILKVNLLNADGQNALFAAVRHNSIDVIDMLLNSGVDITQRERPSGRTVLHLAARDNRHAAIQRLLDYLAEHEPTTSLLGCRDQDGCSAVHTAAQYGAREALIALKLAGADVNAQTNDGRTPIYLAGHAGHKKVRYIVTVGSSIIPDVGSG